MKDNKLILNNDKKIVLNAGQQDAMKKLEAFLKDSGAKVFILKGYAGTGKTTMIKTLVTFMRKQGTDFGLLASTGRAAKILGDITGIPAKTIHSEIYSFGGFNYDTDEIEEEKELPPGTQLTIQFGLKNSSDSADVYIIDEASMISDAVDNSAVQAKFGMGKLLSDLLRFKQDLRFIFVGDPCQLPPVSGEASPALSVSYFKTHFGIKACETTLTEVMRQSGDSGLLQTATLIRQLWQNAPDNETCYPLNKWGRLPLRGHQDLALVKDEESLTNRYLNDIKGGNYSEAAFICKSNSACYKFSLQFRKALGFGGHLQIGELLLVMQNNLISGLRNGDLVVVEHISADYEERAGLTFRKIKVRELNSGKTFTQLMIEDLLYQSQTNLDSRQQNQLFVDFVVRMKKIGIRRKNPTFVDRLMTDCYLNALRLSFGYALTCHKAQGGEWKNVYAAFPRNIMLNPTKQKYQWVYTAITRARQKFFVVDDIYVNGYRKQF